MHNKVCLPTLPHPSHWQQKNIWTCVSNLSTSLVGCVHTQYSTYPMSLAYHRHPPIHCTLRTECHFDSTPSPHTCTCTCKKHYMYNTSWYTHSTETLPIVGLIICIYDHQRNLYCCIHTVVYVCICTYTCTATHTKKCALHAQPCKWTFQTTHTCTVYNYSQACLQWATTHGPGLCDPIKEVVSVWRNLYVAAIM